MFSLIAAVDSKMGIAKQGKIPWHSPEDMKHFSDFTSYNIVIMGRKTWDSLPNNYRPLPNRINIVISKKYIKTNKNPQMIFNSIDQCIEYFNEKHIINTYRDIKKFVIGGEQLYKQFIERDLIGELHITHINHDYECDQFLLLPTLTNSAEFMLTKDILYRCYNTINHEENQFLNLMQNILTNGNKKSDRTGTGTISLFSSELRFDLSTGKLPMMTTRPISLRYVFEELMWVLRGQTDNNILNDKKIHIWDDNTTRKFLDSQGLNDLPEGDIGASYGFQMRRFGSEYFTCKNNYTMQGFDQLSYVINLLKTDPSSRRILMNLWNPSQLNKMALPPCLYGYQFYVANNKLSCKLIQRSSDICLAGSHNCTAGALLVRMLCVVTGLEPGELIWSPSDIHIYNNQIESVKKQLKRTPRPFPTLKIRNPNINDILNFEYKDLQLLNYTPYSKINFAMNA